MCSSGSGAVRGPHLALTAARELDNKPISEISYITAAAQDDLHDWNGDLSLQMTSDWLLHGQATTCQVMSLQITLINCIQRKYQLHYTDVQTFPSPKIWKYV